MILFMPLGVEGGKKGWGGGDMVWGSWENGVTEGRFFS